MNSTWYGPVKTINLRETFLHENIYMNTSARLVALSSRGKADDAFSCIPSLDLGALGDSESLGERMTNVPLLESSLEENLLTG